MEFKKGKIKNKSYSFILRSFCIMLCVLFITALSGCSLNSSVASLLSPPIVEGEFAGVQTALEEYIASVSMIGASNEYSLKYPSTGEKRSSFLINPNDANQAIVFYKTESQQNIHINIVNKTNEQWVSVFDIAGTSSSIHEVGTIDIDGDGIHEFYIGWEIGSRDKILGIYSFDNNTVNSWLLEVYHTMVVNKFMGDNKDNIITLYASSTESLSTATLWSVSSSNNNAGVSDFSVSAISSVRLDGAIKEFSNANILFDEKVGTILYVDGLHPSGVVTELIYWDRKSKQLTAPLYDAEGNSTYLSYRDAQVASRDIDGDGNIEWPSLKKVVSVESEEVSKVFRSSWYKWSFEKKEKQLVVEGIYNVQNSYFFQLENSWSNVYPEYVAKGNELILSTHDSKNVRHDLLIIKAIVVDKTPESDSEHELLEDQNFRFLYSFDNVEYFVWFSDRAPTYFTLDSIKKYFVPIINS